MYNKNNTFLFIKPMVERANDADDAATGVHRHGNMNDVTHLETLRPHEVELSIVIRSQRGEHE